MFLSPTSECLDVLRKDVLILIPGSLSLAETIHRRRSTGACPSIFPTKICTHVAPIHRLIKETYDDEDHEL